MIESAEALARADAIATVPGVDGILVGANDLAIFDRYIGRSGRQSLGADQVGMRESVNRGRHQCGSGHGQRDDRAWIPDDRPGVDVGAVTAWCASALASVRGDSAGKATRARPHCQANSSDSQAFVQRTDGARRALIERATVTPPSARLDHSL